MQDNLVKALHDVGDDEPVSINEADGETRPLLTQENGATHTDEAEVHPA